MTKSPYRTPETCSYRNGVFFESGREYAHCNLLKSLTGLEDPLDRSLLRASRGACEACCKKRRPSEGEINSVVASLLHALSEKIRDRGGSPGCDVSKAKELEIWARNNLVVLPAIPATKVIPNRTEPCFYLGDQTGEKDCPDCRGSVRLKTFRCLHASHEETTRRGCRACQDYDESLTSRKVASWAVGVTTAQRTPPTLLRSLQSLATAGWAAPYLFAEPDSVPAHLNGKIRVIERHTPYGAWPNWYTAAVELYMMHPKADAYLLCQDDVLYGKELRGYLEQRLWPSGRLGVVSLHTPSHRARPNWRGFHPDNEGWSAWGAQAYVFSNPSMRAMLRDPGVVNHRNRGPRDGLRNIDSVIGFWCTSSGLDYYIHQPSLTQHIGESSTLWPDATTAGKRRASNFVGVDSPVAKLLDPLWQNA